MKKCIYSRHRWQIISLNSLYSILGALLLLAVNSYSADAKVYKQNLALHAECGHLLDKYYYDAGTAVDMVKYDLELLKKQGVKVADALLFKTKKADKHLRQQWLALEKRRQNIFKQLYLPKPADSYLLCVENLENMPAVASGWIGFKSFKLEWSNGQSMDIPLKSFLRAAYRSEYKYNCEPAPAMFIYGKQSERHTSVTTIRPGNIPPGPARLIISGLDCDKGGKPARISIYIFGTKIHSGPNPFRKNGWTRHLFNIPEKAFSKSRKASKLNNDVSKELITLKKDIESFAKRAAASAQAIKSQAAPWRSKLQPIHRKPVTPGWWKKKYMRVMDVNNSLYREDQFMHPGNYMNMEYVAKACATLGTNLSTLQVGRKKSDSEMFRITRKFAENSSSPFLLWSSNQFFINGDMRDFKYYGKQKKLSADTDRFIKKFAVLPNFAGIQVDEPVIEDRHRRMGRLLDNPEVVKAYGEYIKQRHSVLRSNGIKNIPEAPRTKKPKNSTEQVLWMEWQYFKMSYMADHFKKLFEMIVKRNLLPSIVIMNKTPVAPQSCSYVAMGRALPYLGTDLYNNGSVKENFSIQLLKNATAGQVIMWPGAGYSCKSPATFKRTLAIALTHADGIHMWTYKYCSKYRDANFFWRFGGSRPNLDDRGRSMLNNWHPDYWYILKDMYRLAGKAESSLEGRKSLAQAAVLISERTLIANIPKRMSVNYYNNCLGLYSDMIGSSIPLDVCFVENLNKNKLDRYKYLVLSDAAVMTPAEIKKLKEWVYKGGILVASGSTSSSDVWGRKTARPGLRELWGKKVSKDKSTPLKNSYGNGIAYYFGTDNIGRRTERIPDSGFSGKGNKKIKIFLTNLLKSICTKQPIIIEGLPAGVEYQLQKNDAGYIVNLIDWFDKRSVKGHTLKLNLPGRWTVSYPGSKQNPAVITTGMSVKLHPFKIYEMIIISKAE
jgi:hypothetical protein